MHHRRLFIRTLPGLALVAALAVVFLARFAQINASMHGARATAVAQEAPDRDGAGAQSDAPAGDPLGPDPLRRVAASNGLVEVRDAGGVVASFASLEPEDGFGDAAATLAGGLLAVGAPTSGLDAPLAGRVYVLPTEPRAQARGPSAAGQRAAEPTLAQRAAPIILTTGEAGARFGTGVAALEDPSSAPLVLVTAPGAGEGSKRGRAYLFNPIAEPDEHGALAPFAELSGLPGDAFGVAAERAEDLDGDGRADAAVFSLFADDSFNTRLRRQTFTGAGDLLERQSDEESPIVRLAGDLNADGVVDAADLGQLLSNFGRASGPGGVAHPGDLNRDGVVDGSDLSLLLGSFGKAADDLHPEFEVLYCFDPDTGLHRPCDGDADGDPDGGGGSGGDDGLGDGDGGGPGGVDGTGATGGDGGGGGGTSGGDGGGGDPPPPGCSVTIEGPKFIGVNESADYALSISGADEVMWTVEDVEGLVQVDSPTLTAPELAVTALDQAGTMTLTVEVTADGQMCAGELEVTVGRIDMVAHRPQTEFFDFESHTIPDDKEEDPGAGVRLNGDDDNMNDAPDSMDLVAPDNQSPLDNDLLKVDLTLEPYPPPDGVQYFLTRSTGVIRVWADRAIVLHNADEEELGFDAATDPGMLTLWVEAVEPGASVLTLEARDEETGEVLASDSIRFFTFSSTVIVFTGEDRSNTGWGHGTTHISRLLYEDGYDVHLHSEEESVMRAGDPSGELPAMQEIISAVEDRDVSEVAIIGYSHGGGSLYDVSTRLAQNPPAGGFMLEFTAYIDAIEDDSDVDTDSETRLPMNTLFHVNLWQPIVTPVGLQYELNDLFGAGAGVRGAPVPGSNIDINVNAPIPNGLGLNADHSSIDNAVTVQNLIITELKEHVQQ